MSGPYTRLGAVLSALIVVFSIIGITMHRDFYAGRGRREFFCFYTNVSNLAVLLYFALAAQRLYTAESLHHLIPHAEFAVMMCIMLTHCVFHLILYPAVRSAVRDMPRTAAYRIVCTDNFIIHYLVPLSVLIYWLLCSPDKQALSPPDALYWTALPLLYAVLIFIRARFKGIIEEAGSPYPYPFLDISVFGAKRVLFICTRLYVLCVFAGLSIIAALHILK